jgi:hypothetical protein
VRSWAWSVATLPGVLPTNSAIRAAPVCRSTSMRNIRSSMAAYPAPNSTSSKVTPLMNGTPNASRWIVTPGRGDFVLTTVAGVKSARL